MKGKPVASKTDKEIVKSGPQFTMEELRGVDGYEAALALFQSKHGEGEVRVAGEVLGDGFRLLDNKDQLIEKPFFAMEWRFTSGDFGEFVTVKLVTEDNKKLIMNDGSTGIRDQLSAFSAEFNRYGGLLCPNGLRRSDYEFEDPETGKQTPAQTYYLDLSA